MDLEGKKWGRLIATLISLFIVIWVLKIKLLVFWPIVVPVTIALYFLCGWIGGKIIIKRENLSKKLRMVAIIIGIPLILLSSHILILSKVYFLYFTFVKLPESQVISRKYVFSIGDGDYRGMTVVLNSTNSNTNIKSFYLDEAKKRGWQVSTPFDDLDILKIRNEKKCFGLEIRDAPFYNDRELSFIDKNNPNLNWVYIKVPYSKYYSNELCHPFDFESKGEREQRVKEFEEAQARADEEARRSITGEDEYYCYQVINSPCRRDICDGVPNVQRMCLVDFSKFTEKCRFESDCLIGQRCFRPQYVQEEGVCVNILDLRGR